MSTCLTVSYVRHFYVARHAIFDLLIDHDVKRKTVELVDTVELANIILYLYTSEKSHFSPVCIATFMATVRDI